MSELFGAVAGERLAVQDMQSQQLHNLAMQGDLIKIQQAKISLETSQRMLAAMSGPQGKAETPEQLATDMERMATIAMNSGNPEKAKEFATAGTNLRKNAAEIADKQAADQIKTLNVMGTLLQGVNSPEGWQQANDSLSLMTGKPSPFAKVPYDPQIVDRLKNGIQTAKDRAQTQAALARVKATEAEEAERKARIPLVKEQARVAKARADALEKAGVKPPTAADLKAITDLMTRDYGGAALPEDMRVLARPIAEHMREIIQTENRSQSEAATIAYQNAKAHGDLGGLAQRPIQKGSIKAPLELPMSGKNIDKSKLLENRWYNVQGTPRLLMKGKLYSKDELEGGEGAN